VARIVLSALSALLSLVLVVGAVAANPQPKPKKPPSCATVLTPALLKSVTGISATVKVSVSKSASDCSYRTSDAGIGDGVGAKVLGFAYNLDAAKFYDLKYSTAQKSAARFSSIDADCAPSPTTPPWGAAECAPQLISGLGSRAYTFNIDTVVLKGTSTLFLETWWKHSNAMNEGLIISTEQMQTLMRAILPKVK
jgi:hypothetical protein